MARAKRTARSEARRRYRAYLQDEAESQALAAEAKDDEIKAASRATPSKPAPAVAPGQRLGFGAAIRAATRPVHYRDDLRYAPQLVLHTHAVWVPVAIGLVAFVYGMTRNDYQDPGIAILFNFVFYPAPLIQAFLAGFLAPRASWLAGAISGFANGIFFAIFYTYVFSGRLANTPSGSILHANQIPLDVLNFVFGATVISMALAAGSAWYKRFLSSMGPGRPSQKSSQRAQSRRTAAASRGGRR